MSKIKRVGWSLCCEWWCAPMDASVEDVVAAIHEGVKLPVSDDSLVVDRCYGGFLCAEDAECRHFALMTGNYSYTSGVNRPATEDDRSKDWARTIEASAGDGRFVGGGLFTEDAPAIAKPEEVKP